MWLTLLFACGSAPESALAPDPAPVVAAPTVAAPLIVAAPPIVERPIRFDAERTELTIAYRQLHSGAATDVVIEPRVIVLHWTAIPTLEASFAAFDPVRLPGAREDIAAGGAVNVSAHFLVDRDGTIVRLMPETTMARHTIGLNHVAIGIENVGGLPDHPLTDAQVDANAALVRWLAATHDIEVLVGHHEAAALEGSPYYREQVDGYRTVKVDPGDAFMAAVRAKVADLGLAGA